jgi:hypothetical protein
MAAVKTKKPWKTGSKAWAIYRITSLSGFGTP